MIGSSGTSCSGSDTATVILLPPEAPIYDYTHVKGCPPLQVQLLAYTNTNYVDTFIWDFRDGSPLSYLQNPVHTYTIPGIYYPKLTLIGDGGVVTRYDTVEVYEMPVMDFDVWPRSVMLPQTGVHFYNYSQNGATYLWDLGETTTTQKEPYYFYTKPGLYDVTLTVWTEHECRDTMTMQQAVLVEAPGSILFPNAFSPSENGPTGGAYPCGEEATHDPHENDIFHPVYKSVTTYKLEIYNRWGEKIYESNDVCIGWDGYIDGKMAPQDVYVWKITGRYKNSSVYTKVGNVTLLR
jgi:gliding motility-associated-like protein